MNIKEAKAIIGNQSGVPVRNMAKALQMLSWNNDSNEWRRLLALKTLGYKVKWTKEELLQEIEEAMSREGLSS